MTPVKAPYSKYESLIDYTLSFKPDTEPSSQDKSTYDSLLKSYVDFFFNFDQYSQSQTDSQRYSKPSKF